MMFPRLNIVFGAIVFALALVRPAAAEQMPIPDVTVTPLGGPGTAAYAVNNRGDVVMTAPQPYVYMGFTLNVPRTALWTGGTLVDVGASCPNCQFGLSTGQDVNESRQVVGYANTTNGYRGFSWKDGVWTELQSPASAGFVMPMAVNDAGQIAGYISDQETGGVRGVFWESATSAPIVTSSALVQDINNRGELAATKLVGACVRAGIETPRGFEDVTTALACPYAIAQAINDARAIAANLQEYDPTGNNPPVQLAMLFKDGQRDMLTPAGAFTASEASARGLNDASDVAGRSFNRTPPPGTCGAQATLWLREGVVALESPFTDAAGCTSVSAAGINIHGQVVGSIAGRAMMWHANIDRFAPTVTQLNAAPVWPPKSNAAPMTFTGRVVDLVHGPSSASGVGSVTYRIIDEYGSYQPSGTLSVSPDGDFSVTLPLQQVKGGDHDGRTYVFEVVAADRAQNAVTSSVTVQVTHGRPR